MVNSELRTSTPANPYYKTLLTRIPHSRIHVFSSPANSGMLARYYDPLRTILTSPCSRSLASPAMSAATFFNTLSTPDTLSECELKATTLCCIVSQKHVNNSTARPGKAEALAKQYEGKIDVVEFADLVKGDYSEALNGKPNGHVYCIHTLIVHCRCWRGRACGCSSCRKRRTRWHDSGQSVSTLSCLQRACLSRIFQSAVEGGLNIVRQAVANGINKIVITSSFVTAADFDKPERFFTDYTTTENGMALPCSS